AGLDAFGRRAEVLDAVDPDVEVIDRFRSAMDDDLDTPTAMALVFDTVRRANVALDAGDAASAAPLAAAVSAMLSAVGLRLAVAEEVPDEVLAGALGQPIDLHEVVGERSAGAGDGDQRGHDRGAEVHQKPRKARTRGLQHGFVEVVLAHAAKAHDVFFGLFVNHVHDVIGVEPELLSGLDEGKLSFRGATADLDPANGPFLVFDIGGGSTEFAFGTDEAEAAMSLDIGCVRLTEKYVEHDPPRPEELVACLSITEAHLDDVARQMPQIAHAATFVGLAGTVSTAAAVELGLADYDRDQIHHFVLTKEAAEDVYRTLVTEARDDRIHNPGLEEARADVIVGGMCILVRIMRYFDIEELVVSEADILDGLVFSLLS
ncbi:MAG: hypothetical protein EBY61_08400, partial [Actinobacteria bacterium]|nr:hypothetical protein [Actinomycetota bacterium]